MDERVARFHRLHESGCFVIPNPWDIGSARVLVQLGFKAIATTSSGFAWTQGRRDNHVTLDQVLAHLRAMSAAVDVPVNADFEGGFAVRPEDVAKNVAAACETGIAGLSVEDSTHDEANPLFAFDLAVERIRAAREAIDRSGTGVLLVGRTESGAPNLEERIRRLKAYSAAGADCLFAPGLHDIADIRAIVQAVAPKPVNVLVSTDFTTVSEMRDAGVRRISVGGALARAAWAAFYEAASEIAEKGTFTALTRAMPGTRVNGFFT